MTLVISDKRVVLLENEIVTKTVITEVDGKGQQQCRLIQRTDRVSLEPGVQKQIDDKWLENEHLKMLVADGAPSVVWSLAKPGQRKDQP